MSRKLVSPKDQIKLNLDRIATSEEFIAEAKRLIDGDDPDEADRGRGMLEFNHADIIPARYCIAQIKWRCGFGDPTDDLIQTVMASARMITDCRSFGVPFDFYFADLVAFVTVILSGSVSPWLLPYQRDISDLSSKRRKLTPWEVNLGAQTALVVAIDKGEFPDVWARLLAESEGRPSLKRISQYNKTYEELFHAVRNRAWSSLPRIEPEVNSNYRKRGSSEISHADVYGDGPYNSRSIDFIAAALLRVGQSKDGFPISSDQTPHFWQWGTRDLSDIEPSAV